jgi:hypothetical protein
MGVFEVGRWGLGVDDDELSHHSGGADPLAAALGLFRVLDDTLRAGREPQER